MRQTTLESALCRAIQERLLVRLEYDRDFAPRLFAPHAVYRSTRNKINVSGTQIENPMQPLDSFEPRIFEIGRIRACEITFHHFQPDTWFDRLDPRYQNGIICSV
ncbi:MAG TPA: hypothetical protein VJ770_08050 [Stellaceae bacterium]|nr:hypothetical protein [Stellaceae bacterium]